MILRAASAQQAIQTPEQVSEKKESASVFSDSVFSEGIQFSVKEGKVYVFGADGKDTPFEFSRFESDPNIPENASENLKTSFLLLEDFGILFTAFSATFPERSGHLSDVVAQLNTDFLKYVQQNISEEKSQKNGGVFEIRTSIQALFSDQDEHKSIK